MLFQSTEAFPKHEKHRLVMAVVHGVVVVENGVVPHTISLLFTTVTACSILPTLRLPTWFHVWSFISNFKTESRRLLPEIPPKNKVTKCERFLYQQPIANTVLSTDTSFSPQVHVGKSAPPSNFVHVSSPSTRISVFLAFDPEPPVTRKTWTKTKSDLLEIIDKQPEAKSSPSPSPGQIKKWERGIGLWAVT